MKGEGNLQTMRECLWFNSTNKTTLKLTRNQFSWTKLNQFWYTMIQTEMILWIVEPDLNSQTKLVLKWFVKLVCEQVKTFKKTVWLFGSYLTNCPVNRPQKYSANPAPWKWGCESVVLVLILWCIIMMQPPLFSFIFILGKKQLPVFLWRWNKYSFETIYKSCLQKPSAQDREFCGWFHCWSHILHEKHLKS
jgi:hypothetical protein